MSAQIKFNIGDLFWRPKKNYIYYILNIHNGFITYKSIKTNKIYDCVISSLEQSIKNENWILQKCN